MRRRGNTAPLCVPMPRKDPAERRAYDKKFLAGYRRNYGKAATELRKVLRSMPAPKLIAMMEPLDDDERDVIFTFTGRIRPT